MVYEVLLKIYKTKIVKFPELMLLGLKLEIIDRENRSSLWYLISAARIQYTSLVTKEDSEAGRLDCKRCKHN